LKSGLNPRMGRLVPLTATPATLSGIGFAGVSVPMSRTTLNAPSGCLRQSEK
jgi:hypothetical protein